MDSEAGEAPAKEGPPWYKLKHHPMIYIMFLLNWVEFCVWFATICSSQVNKMINLSPVGKVLLVNLLG